MSCTNHPDVLTGLDRCSRCGKSFCQDCLISLQGAQVCAGCKGERVLDIRSGATGDLELAGRGARLGGAIIDGLVIVIPFLGLVLLIGGMGALTGKGGEIGITIAVIAIGILLPGFYEGAMLAARGQTLGKIAINAKVVNADGSPLTGWQPWTRAFSRTIMSATRILGAVDTLFIFSKDRTTLHDRIARTRVVRTG